MKIDKIENWALSAMQFAGIGICRYSKEGKIIDIDSVAFNVLALHEQFENPDQLIGLFIKDITNDTLYTLFQYHIQTNEISFKLKNGNEKLILCKYFSEYDEHIKEELSIVCIKEKTQYNQSPICHTENEFYLSEERYKILSEITTDSATSSLVYPDGRIEREWIIDKLFQEYGYSPADLDTLAKWREIIHPDDIILFDESMQRVKQGESVSVDLRLYTKQGFIKWINNSIQTRKTEMPGVLRLLSAVKDISVKKETELALHESEERFKSIISNASNVAIQIYDARGVVLYWNPAAVDLYEVSAKQALGKTLDQLIFTPETNREFLAVLEEINLTRESHGPKEWECVLQNGSVKFIYSVIFPLSITSENTDFVCIDINITDTKKSKELQIQIEQAEFKDQVKSQFMANLSHEIRNPLNAIIGLSQTLLKSQLSDEQKQFVDSIRISSNNLLNILNDVLDYSKLEANRMELYKRPFALHDFVNEIKSIYLNRFKEKGLHFNTAVDGLLPLWLNADDVKLKQIISNLLSNAFKFTNNGGVDLLFNLKTKEVNHVIIEIVIRDTGIGIKEKDFKKLFKSFSQIDSSTSKEYAGTGLGLVLVKNYTELMGGTVSFTSKYEQGTKFVITIPIEISEQETNINQKILHIFNHKEIPNFTILLAEDDGINRLYLTNFLKSEGFKVVIAKDGNEAVAKFTQGGIDIILMDCQMPRKDGFEATCEIRKLETQMNVPHIPVIALTGYSYNEIKEQYTTSGMTSYIIKPLNEQDLIAQIMELIIK